MDISKALSEYLIKEELKSDLISVFCEEYELSDETCIEFFNIIAEEEITYKELFDILNENGLILCADIFEDSSTTELVRKRRIEQHRKELGAQFKSDDNSSSAQRLSTSALRLSTFKIDKSGKFVPRAKPGDIEKIRSNLEKKKTQHLTFQGKRKAALATAKRQNEVRSGRGASGKRGSSNFVQQVKRSA